MSAEIDYAWAGDFLDAWVAARMRLDISPFVDLFAEDATFQTGPFALPLAGTNALRAYLLRLADAEADVDLTLERHWVSGASILAAWHGSHQRRPDGGLVREAGFLTAEIRNRRCTSFRLWTVAKGEDPRA